MSKYLLIQAGDNKDNQDSKAGEDSNKEASKDGPVKASKVDKVGSKDGVDSKVDNKEAMVITVITRMVSATDGEEATSIIR